MSLEIERKWILKKEPNELIEKSSTIYQSYLSVNDDVELRIRKTVTPNGDVFRVLDIKDHKPNLSRIEVTKKLTEEEYESLLSLCKGNPIVKKYRSISYDRGHRIQVSNVDNGEFIYAEVEFTSEEDAKEFSFPWVGLVDKEVTGDPNYYLSNYWLRTRSE